MSEERKENIEMQDTESLESRSLTSDTSCYEFCELYQLNGILACIDCGNNLPY